MTLRPFDRTAARLGHGLARALVVLTLATLPAGAWASGHGPVFGLATPTLGRGGFSLDWSVMGRSGDVNATMMRPMLGYGITEDFQVSVSLPMALDVPEGSRPVRMMSMMPANPDIEVLAGWRFHRTGRSVGARFESTAYLGFLYPTDTLRAGVRTAPGLYGAVVTGYASRTVYAWAGAQYRRYMTPTGDTADHPGDLAMVSLVLGYRPTIFQKDYPHADWRIFLEVVGEHSGDDRIAGQIVPNTGGRQLFVGPTVLGLYGKWGVSGGPLFRVYDDLDDDQSRDTLRWALNFTLWF